MKAHSLLPTYILAKHYVKIYVCLYYTQLVYVSI